LRRALNGSSIFTNKPALPDVEFILNIIYLVRRTVVTLECNQFMNGRDETERSLWQRPFTFAILLVMPATLSSSPAHAFRSRDLLRTCLENYRQWEDKKTELAAQLQGGKDREAALLQDDTREPAQIAKQLLAVRAEIEAITARQTRHELKAGPLQDAIAEAVKQSRDELACVHRKLRNEQIESHLAVLDRMIDRDRLRRKGRYSNLKDLAECSKEVALLDEAIGYGADYRYWWPNQPQAYDALFDRLKAQLPSDAS
jgi:hypothetical protein